MASPTMKVREVDPQTPPSPVNIPPLHLYASHNQIAKRPGAAVLHLSAPSASESVSLLK